MEKDIETVLKVQSKVFLDLDKALEDYFLDNLYYDFSVLATKESERIEMEFGLPKTSVDVSKILFGLVDSSYGEDYFVTEISPIYFEVLIIHKNNAYRVILPRSQAGFKLALESIRTMSRQIAEQFLMKDNFLSTSLGRTKK